MTSGTNAGGNSTVQFTATPLNAGTSPTITWQQLSGPGSVSPSGLYTAPNTAPTTAVVTLVATVTSSTNQTATATVEFTIAADALTSTTPPQTVATGRDSSYGNGKPDRSPAERPEFDGAVYTVVQQFAGGRHLHLHQLRSASRRDYQRVGSESVL